MTTCNKESNHPKILALAERERKRDRWQATGRARYRFASVKTGKLNIRRHSTLSRTLQQTTWKSPTFSFTHLPNVELRVFPRTVQKCEMQQSCYFSNIPRSLGLTIFALGWALIRISKNRQGVSQSRSLVHSVLRLTICYRIWGSEECWYCL